MAKIISHVVLICESSSNVMTPPCLLTDAQSRLLRLQLLQNTNVQKKDNTQTVVDLWNSDKLNSGLRVDSTDRHQSHLAKKLLGCAGRHCDVITVNLAATTLNCTA